MKNKANTVEAARLRKRIAKAVRRIDRGKNVEQEREIKEMKDHLGGSGEGSETEHDSGH